MGNNRLNQSQLALNERLDIVGRFCETPPLPTIVATMSRPPSLCPLSAVAAAVSLGKFFSGLEYSGVAQRLRSLAREGKSRHASS